MRLGRLRAIGKTDKVLLEWKPVQRSAKKWRVRCYSQAKGKNPDLIFITIIMEKQLSEPHYFSAMKLC